jgi:hypothetical protein
MTVACRTPYSRLADHDQPTTPLPRYRQPDTVTAAAFAPAAAAPAAASTPAASAPNAPESRLPVSLVTLMAAAGVLVASVAYAAGRQGYASSPWANRAYWLGQALILVPVAARLLSRRPLSATGAATLVIVLTVAEYLLKVCYSPLSFTFTDELLHWRSTVNLIQTGKLFTVNYGLPIGPRYPGLEEVTSALVSVTGLPIFAAGLIVAGVAHLLFICLLYLTFQFVSRSVRVGGIAALVYSSTPSLNSFDAMFVYETLALAFLALSLLAAWRAAGGRSRGERGRSFVLAVLAILATVMTHHVTSYILVGSLFLVALAGLLTRAWRTALTVGALAVISAAAVACWVIFVAPATLAYFRPTAEGLAEGIYALQTGASSHAPSTSASPPGDQLLEGIVIVAITIVLPLGWWQVWRRHCYDPWVLAMALGSLGWFVALAIRLGTPDGQELAGRAATFVYIPVSLIIALVVSRLVDGALARRWESVAVAIAVAGTLTFLFDGLANGWPPYWERLPGPHQVAGFERSIGPEEIATAQWTLSALGPGQRFAADIGIYPALIGYGDQNPLQNVGFLYFGPRYTPAIARAARAQAVQYILVDQRLSQSLPASGSYFPGDNPRVSGDTMTGNGPIPLRDLTKFNHVGGVSRIYDNGDIVIYDLQGAQVAP